MFYLLIQINILNTIKHFYPDYSIIYISDNLFPFIWIRKKMWKYSYLDKTQHCEVILFHFGCFLIIVENIMLLWIWIKYYINLWLVWYSVKMINFNIALYTYNCYNNNRVDYIILKTNKKIKN